MKKTVKKIIIAVVVLALAGGGAAAGLLISKSNTAPVKVYDVSNLSVTDYWGDRKTYYGPVTTDRIQPVYISGTQMVKEVYVTEGQQVKQGDPLVAYDSTLTELNIAAKQIEIQQKERDLEKNEKEMEQLLKYRPGVDIPENGYDPGADLVGLDVRAADSLEDEEGIKVASLGGFVFAKEGQNEGDPEGGDPEGGDPEGGDPEGGDPEGGDPEGGDPEGGDPEGGNPEGGDPEGGDPEGGDPEGGDPEGGDPEDESSENESSEEETSSEETTTTEEETTAPKKEVAFRVRFKGGNKAATGSMKTLTVYKDETAVLPENGFTLEGFDFAGWNTKRNGSGLAYEDKAEITQPLDENGKPIDKLVLYAQWTVARPPFPTLVQGKGTEKSPYIYLWRSDDIINAKMMEYLAGSVRLNKGRAASVILMSRDGDILEGAHMGSLTFTISKKDSETVMLPTGFLTWDQDPLAKPEPEPIIPPDPVWPDPVIPGISYTAKELEQFKSAKELKITDLKLELEGLKLELDNMQAEFENDIIRAKLDGVVKNITDPDSAAIGGSPLLMVSGGGGYYAECNIDEFALQKLQIGQSAQIISWNTGMTVTGTVSSISEFPSENQEFYGGNSNVTSYPVKLFIDEDANLEEGEYVEISIDGQQQVQSGLYLMNAFVRTVDGKSFIYVKNAEGMLEKRTVVTGASIWGEYTQISGDISIDDKIAFPYGDAQDGAPTEDAPIEDLYSEMYGF